MSLFFSHLPVIMTGFRGKSRVRKWILLGNRDMIVHSAERRSMTTGTNTKVQTDNKILDDLARLGQSAAGTFHGIKTEVEHLVRQRLENMLCHMDLVSREEYEVVREMAATAREENERLAARLEELEQKISQLEKKKK